MVISVDVVALNKLLNLSLWSFPIFAQVTKGVLNEWVNLLFRQLSIVVEVILLKDLIDAFFDGRFWNGTH